MRGKWGERCLVVNEKHRTFRKGLIMANEALPVGGPTEMASANHEDAEVKIWAGVWRVVGNPC